MYRYLIHKTADYTTETLSVTPQEMMTEVGDKKQVIHEFDDGSISVVGLSIQSYFSVQLQWTYISETDKSFILELYHNPVKADARRRTFYWEHPTDGRIYVVRFTSSLGVESFPTYAGVQTVLLRVEGKKLA